MKKQTFITKGRDSWFVADFETITANTNYYKTNKDTGLVLFYMKNWTEDEEYIGVNMDEFWNVLMSFDKSTTIFFHNLSFDGDFIVKYLFNHTDFKCNWNNTLNNRYFNVFRQGGRIYYIHIFYRKRVGKNVRVINIYIRCSYMLLSTSIGVLGKSVNIAKRSQEQIDDKAFYDWEPVNTLAELQAKPNGQAYIDYCKRDVDIALISLKNFEQTIKQLPTIKAMDDWNSRKKRQYNVFSSKITAASIASNLLKKYTNKYIYEHKLNDQDINCNDLLRITPEQYEFISPWYYGGWSQINTEYVGDILDIKHGVMVDVSSAYPYQMTKPLPYGEILTTQPDGNYYEFLVVEVKYAKIKEKYKNVPILKNWNNISTDDGYTERYARELKDFTCYYIAEEWEMLNKFYDIKVKSMSAYYMKAEPYLHYFSEEVYSEKDRYSKEGNSGLKQSTKIILNSAYGTLAKRMEFNSFMYVPTDYCLIGDKKVSEMNKGETFSLVTEDGVMDYEFKHITEAYDSSDEYNLVVVKELKEKKSAPNKAAAAVITALERVYLWSLIDYIGPQYFALSDTDSVTFINLNKKTYDKILSITGKGLGAWELETEFKFFATYGAKKYIMLTDTEEIKKMRFAGLKQEQAELNIRFKDYYLNDKENKFDFGSNENYISGAILDRVNCKSGIVLIPKDKVFKKTYN